MFRPRVIPVLLLKGQGLVKTVQFKKPNYIGDPINAVKIFNDKECDELIFLDITASKENRSIDLKTVKDIADEAYMPFAVGGGIKDVKTAKALINAGAEKVIINSAFATNPDLISEIANELGNQSVVVSIDVNKNWLGKTFAYTHSGTKKVNTDILALAQLAAEKGAGEIMINSIANDGLMTGYDLELIKHISEHVSIPVIACGGAGKLDDLKAAHQAGAHALAAGSMFVYQGPHKAVLINYLENAKEIDMF
ncbi:MAG: imidazole glycerol phosphate synthase subunit HisF [Sphingobacteriaceae bacterium]|nr:imidazole glycerol phosphate synthase subunit HisF [Sphingobacteriaceae bacterium]